MELNRTIDHTILRADATPEDIDRLCQEARDYHFYSCCVNSTYVKQVHDRLQGSDVSTCCVVGFPLGAMATEAKLAECKTALEDGADEIDMVINIGRLKAGQEKEVEEEIRRLKEAVGPDRVLKVIIECCLLSREEKVLACRLAVKAGADFVKTSTGFSTGGATAEDVRLMKETVGDACKVKASGGIHSREEAMEMIEAGAERIGASAGIRIVSGD